MDFVRKVLQSMCKNEISLEVNAYVKASNIRIGVLNPNPANLSINLSPEKVEHLHGPYKIFTDIVQEDKKSLVFLLGTLKNDQLICLRPEPLDENAIKSKSSKNVLHFKSYEETDCSKKFGPEKSKNMSFWERLSKPTPRALQNLEAKQASKMKSEALNLTIDGNFIKKRMTKKSLRRAGISFVKVKGTDSQANSIPWEYYTVDYAYIKKSWDESKNKTQSSSVTGSSFDFTETTIQSNANQSVTSLDNYESCVADEKVVSEIKATTPNDRNSKLNATYRKEPSRLTHNLYYSGVKHSTPMSARQARSQNYSSNSHFQTESLAGEDNQTIYCTATENTTESAELQDMQCNKEKSSGVNLETEPSNEASNMVLHVFSKAPQQSLQTVNPVHQENETYEHITGRTESLENIFENVYDEKMEEILLTLIRNTKIPVSIDILPQTDTDSSKCESVRSLENKMDEYYRFKEALSQDRRQNNPKVPYGPDERANIQEEPRRNKVVNVEVHRLQNRLPINVYDSNSSLSTIGTESMNEVIKSVCGYRESISSLFSISSDDTSEATFILKNNRINLGNEFLTGNARYENQSQNLHRAPKIQNINLIEGKSLVSDLTPQFLDGTFCVTKSTENLEAIEEMLQKQNKDFSAIIPEIKNLQALNLNPENNKYKLNVNITEEIEKSKTNNEIVSPAIVEEELNSKCMIHKCENWTQTDWNISQETGNQLKIADLQKELFDKTKPTDGNKLNEFSINLDSQELNISSIVKESQQLIASIDKKFKPNNDKLTPWWIRLSTSKSSEDKKESKRATACAERRNTIAFGRTLSHRSSPPLRHNGGPTKKLKTTEQSLERQVTETKSRLDQLIQAEQELKKAQCRAKQATSKPIVSDRLRKLSQPKSIRTAIRINLSQDMKATWKF